MTRLAAIMVDLENTPYPARYASCANWFVSMCLRIVHAIRVHEKLEGYLVISGEPCSGLFKAAILCLGEHYDVDFYMYAIDKPGRQSCFTTSEYICSFPPLDRIVRLGAQINWNEFNMAMSILLTDSIEFSRVASGPFKLKELIAQSNGSNLLLISGKDNDAFDLYGSEHLVGKFLKAAERYNFDIRD